MKEKISVLYKIFIIIMSIIGIYLNFKIAPINEMLLYFTIQSNIACLVFYTVTIIMYLLGKLKKSNLYYIFKGMMTMSINVTMIVYWLFVYKNVDTSIYVNHMTACRFVHLYVPLLVTFDYILFGIKGNLKKNYPFIWSITLIAYIVFDFIYVNLGGTFLGGKKYPYEFLNITDNGYVNTILICGTIFIFYIAYGKIVELFDEKVSKRGDKRNGK